MRCLWFVTRVRFQFKLEQKEGGGPLSNTKLSLNLLPQLTMNLKEALVTALRKSSGLEEAKPPSCECMHACVMGAWPRSSSVHR